MRERKKTGGGRGRREDEREGEGDEGRKRIGGGRGWERGREGGGGRGRGCERGRGRVLSLCFSPFHLFLSSNLFSPSLSPSPFHSLSLPPTRLLLIHVLLSPLFLPLILSSPFLPFHLLFFRPFHILLYHRFLSRLPTFSFLSFSLFLPPPSSSSLLPSTSGHSVHSLTKPLPKALTLGAETPHGTCTVTPATRDVICAQVPRQLHFFPYMRL